MDEEQNAKELLCQQLGTVDESLRFLVLTILSVLLSLWTVVIQRRQLVCTIEGNTEAAQAIPSVFPIRLAASALIVGSLGYFFSLSLQTCAQAAEGDDCVAQKSAGMNVWAGFFVFIAALIRLYDLNYVQRCQSTLETADDELPD